MPVVKATIGGREYSFAPLLLKEIRYLKNKRDEAGADVFSQIDLWKPCIESSLKRAGSNSMPDLEEMTIEDANVAFAAMIEHLMKASGMELTAPGEEKPAENPSIATTSTVSS